jgi:hypothetical protein
MVASQSEERSSLWIEMFAEGGKEQWKRRKKRR